MDKNTQQPERCQCCGYLVTESEHKGCLRAGRAAIQPEPVAWWDRSKKVSDVAFLFRKTESHNIPLYAQQPASAQQASIAELERDAARYRWLRDHEDPESIDGPARDMARAMLIDSRKTDEAIDAAMQSSKAV